MPSLDVCCPDPQAITDRIRCIAASLVPLRIALRLRMATKRFRSARYWHNTILLLWTVPFLVLPGVIGAASSGNFTLLAVMLTISLLAVLLAAAWDRRKTFTYELNETQLVISGGTVRHAFPMEDIQDGSLLDRAAAREYLSQHLHTIGAADRPAVVKDFLRFSTMDIGVKSFTLGLGRALIDRMPNAKSDLVLLRLRGNRTVLLSPAYSQDFVESLNRRKLVG